MLFHQNREGYKRGMYTNFPIDQTDLPVIVRYFYFTSFVEFSLYCFFYIKSKKQKQKKNERTVFCVSERNTRVTT